MIEYVQDRGYLMPQNNSTITNHIQTFYEEKKMEMIEKIANLKLQSKKFSITVDEWTNRNSKRFLNITLHHEKPFVLGLVQLRGSCNALKLKEIVEEKLLEFNLSITQDIVASTHDGASVMKKLENFYQSKANYVLNTLFI